MFSSTVSLKTSSLVAVKHVIAFVSDWDAYETVRNIDKRHQMAIHDSVEVSTFLLTTRSQDQILTFYERKEIISLFNLSNTKMRKPFSNDPEWSISLFQKAFMGLYEWGPLTLATNIYQYDVERQEWKVQSKSSVPFGETACRIKTQILFIGSGTSNRVQLLAPNAENDSMSNRVCSAVLPLNDLYGFSLTTAGIKSVILAGGFESRVGNAFLATVYEGFLDEKGI